MKPPEASDALRAPVLTVSPVAPDLEGRRRGLLGVAGLGDLAAIGIPLFVGLLHVAVVAPHYFVGSFDDDAGYILGAKALLAGQGLAGHLTSGAVVAGGYPPGYPLLLAPMVWAFPHSYLPLRLLSVGCYAALFPLTWTYLGGRGVRREVRMGALGLLALCPVAATFAGMVMAEMPFLVVLVVLLLLVDRWSATARVWCRSGVGVLVAAAAMVWLKEAAIAMILGLILWLVVTGSWRKGAVVAAAVAASLVPVVAARLAAGVPVAGSRYSHELGTLYSGGVASRLVHVAPASLHALLSFALPATVVPRGDPLPPLGYGAFAFRVLAWQVSLLTLLGLVVWFRRHRDVTVVMVPAYFAETLLWPYMNERRVILALPVILAWYALGAWTLGAWVVSRTRRLRLDRLSAPVVRASMAAAVAVAVVGPLVAQYPRNYLYGLYASDGRDSSRPAGSRYVALLRAAPPPGAVVETDYQSTVALYTGQRTAEAAFLANIAGFTPSLGSCVGADATLASMTADGAGYLLTGALNKPFLVDGPCLLQQASTSAWAVRLLRSAHDAASVFELIGPGTVHPGLHDLIPSATVSGSGAVSTWALAPQDPGETPGFAPVTASSGRGVLTWDWGRPASLSQVSVGGARSLDGPTAGVQVQVRSSGGRWVTVATSPRGVGDPSGATPFLLARLPAGTMASALRVVVEGTGRVTAVDVHALGSGP